LDLVGVGPLVQPALAPHLVLEVLDCIGDEGVPAGDAGFLERLIQHPASRPHEWLAGQVLLVARLLAHQHDMGASAPFAPDDLRRELVERTAPTGAFSRSQLRECGGFDAATGHAGPVPRTAGASIVAALAMPHPAAGLVYFRIRKPR